MTSEQLITSSLQLWTTAVLRPGQLARYLYVAAVCSVSPLSASQIVLSAMKKLTSDLINIPGFEKLQPSDATSDVTEWEMIDQLLSEVATYTMTCIFMSCVWGFTPLAVPLICMAGTTGGTQITFDTY